VPQQNWVPRTFGLTHKGKLLYYEAATIQEAAASAGGLGQPRQHLDLGKEGCTWATPSNETDGHTKYMVRGGVCLYERGLSVKECGAHLFESKCFSSSHQYAFL
jgi:hypothetical protein